MSQEVVRSKHWRRDGNQCKQLPLHWPSDTITSDPGPIYQYPLDAHQATSCQAASVLPASQPHSQAHIHQPRLSVLETLHQFVHGSSSSKTKDHASSRVSSTESIKASSTEQSAPATVPRPAEEAVAAYVTATKLSGQPTGTAASVSGKTAVTWPAPLMTKANTVDSSWPRNQSQQPAPTPAAAAGQNVDAPTPMNRAHTRSSELVISEPETADYRQDTVLLKMLCSNAIVIGDGCGDWEHSDDEHDHSSGLPPRHASRSITLPPSTNSCPAILMSGEHDSGSYPLMNSWNSDEQLISSVGQNTSGPLATLLHSSIPELENNSPGPHSDLCVKMLTPKAKTVLIGGKVVDLPQAMAYQLPTAQYPGPHANSTASNVQARDNLSSFNNNSNAGSYTAPPRTNYWRHTGSGPRRGSVSATLLVSSMQDLMSIAEGDEEEEEPDSSQTF